MSFNSEKALLKNLLSSKSWRIEYEGKTANLCVNCRHAFSSNTGQYKRVDIYVVQTTILNIDIFHNSIYIHVKIIKFTLIVFAVSDLRDKYHNPAKRIYLHKHIVFAFCFTMTKSHMYETISMLSLRI